MTAVLENAIVDTVAVEFLNKRPETEALALVKELGGDSRRGVSKDTTHYVTDHSNVPQLARATRLGVQCVTLDWLLQCKKLGRCVDVDPFLIDVTEFHGERPNFPVPDSDVVDSDVLDDVCDDQVPAALSESTASTRSASKRATCANPAAAAAMSHTNSNAAQPLPNTAELQNLDASPRDPSHNHSTRSNKSASARQRSPSATVELKPTTQHPVEAHSSPVVVVPVAPPTVISIDPHPVSMLQSTSKIGSKRQSGSFKTPAKKATAAAAVDAQVDEPTNAADVFEFLPSNRKRAPPRMNGHVVDLSTAENSAAGSGKVADNSNNVVKSDDDGDDDDAVTDTSSKRKPPKAKAPAATKAAAKKRKDASESTPPTTKKARSTTKSKLATPVVADETPDEIAEPEEPAVVAVPKSTKRLKTFSKKEKTSKAGAEKKVVEVEVPRDEPSPCAVESHAGRDQWVAASSVSIVFTGGGEKTRHIEDSAKQLGAHIDADVTGRTTHVVLLSDLRTIKVLMGIAMRCWLVQPQWIGDADAKRGLPIGDEYEITCFPGARRARSGEAAPLLDVSVWFAGTDMQPPQKDLKQLLKLAGGKVVASVGKADVVIAGKNSTVWHRSEDDEKPVVKESWLLNCVSNWQKQPFQSHFAREIDASETN